MTAARPPLSCVQEEAPFPAADALARARSGDEESAQALVEHLYPLVLKVIRAHRPRRTPEEDLAQEIFLKMFTKLDSYRGAVPLEHWVSRIAVNHCLNALRAENCRPEWRMADLTEAQSAALEAALGAPNEAPHPAHALGARELVERLLAALAPADRLLIRLLEIEDHTIEEVRRLTGWSATRIRVRAFRARRKLNRRFAALRQEEQR